MKKIEFLQLSLSDRVLQRYRSVTIVALSLKKKKKKDFLFSSTHLRVILIAFSFSSAVSVSPKSNANTREYVRHVFSVVPGILALTGFLLVLFFQPSLPCCTGKGWCIALCNLAAVHKNHSKVTQFRV